MLKKLHSFALFILLALPLVSCVISRVPDIVTPEPTITPIPKIKSVVPLDMQAGDTNFIVILGILIFLFILIPIVLHYKDWRAS
jgi:hypothetical protein